MGKIPFESFGNFTQEMYEGNKPCRTEIDGTGDERSYWSFEHGDAETVGEKVIHAKFSLGYHRCIYIIGNSLVISKFLSNNVVAEYLINSNGVRSFYPTTWREMSLEEAENILNTKIKNCKIWDIVQKRAREIIKENN